MQILVGGVCRARCYYEVRVGNFIRMRTFRNPDMSYRFPPSRMNGPKRDMAENKKGCREIALRPSYRNVCATLFGKYFDRVYA